MKRAAFVLVGLLAAISVAGFAVPLAVSDGSSSGMRVDVVIEAEIGRYTPDVVYASPGDTVRLTLVTNDIPHGLSIVGHDIDLVAMPGQPAEVEFVVDSETRLFEWFCTTYCGTSHGRMNGSLIISER